MIVINFTSTKINKFQCNGVAKFFIPIVKNGFSVGKETALLFFLALAFRVGKKINVLFVRWRF